MSPMIHIPWPIENLCSAPRGGGEGNICEVLANQAEVHFAHVTPRSREVGDLNGAGYN